MQVDEGFESLESQQEKKQDQDDSIKKEFGLSHFNGTSDRIQGPAVDTGLSGQDLKTIEL